MATNPATPPQDVQVLNPNLNQGRDYIVPPQVDNQGNSVLTGQPPRTALDLVTQAEADQPDFDWAVPEEIRAPLNKQKPALPPAHDPDAEINWNYNPQDDFVPAGLPHTPAQIPTLPPKSGVAIPNPRLEDGLQPDFKWDPQSETPKPTLKPAAAKPTLPPVDDVEANMANIWTPDPVYTTGKGTRP